MIEKIKDLLNDVWEYRIWPAISAIKWWVLYRTTLRYNIIKIGPPGYYESDTQMCLAMWKILEDFVEIEAAHMNTICHNRNLKIHWFKKRFGTFRSAKEGMAWLNFQATHKDTTKERRAANKIIIKTYNWYKKDKPKALAEIEKAWEKHLRAYKKVTWDTKKPAGYYSSIRKIMKQEQNFERLELSMLSKLVENNWVMWT